MHTYRQTKRDTRNLILSYTFIGKSVKNHQKHIATIYQNKPNTYEEDNKERIK